MTFLRQRSSVSLLGLVHLKYPNIGRLLLENCNVMWINSSFKSCTNPKKISKRWGKDEERVAIKLTDMKKRERDPKEIEAGWKGINEQTPKEEGRQ